MKKYFFYSSLFALTLGSLTACNNADQQAKEEVHNAAAQTIPEEAKGLIGRWDLTVVKEGKETPAWLEIKLSGFNTLVGYFVSDAGSARPVSHIKLKDGKFFF